MIRYMKLFQSVELMFVERSKQTVNFYLQEMHCCLSLILTVTFLYSASPTVFIMRSGAVSVLFAAALQSRGYAIDHVTVFGTPKFTDKKGAMQLVGSLPIERVEHVMDPVSISPMVLRNT